jgi:transcriptional regulator with XRE-family HTH domain
MRLEELGHAMRQARLGRGLTQAQLAAMAGLSRTTVNQLENGVASDVGVKRVQAILEKLGLTLSLQQIEPGHRQDFLQMAANTASTSFAKALTKDELVRALLTGKVPASKRPHMRALLEEAPASILKGLIQETTRWARPGRIEKNLAAISRDLAIVQRKHD